MTLSMNNQVQVSVEDLMDTLNSVQEEEATKTRSGIAPRPEKAKSKDSDVLGFFRDMFANSQAKAVEAREAIQPEMYKLAKDSAYEVSQARQMADITRSLTEGGGEIGRKPLPEGTTLRPVAKPPMTTMRDVTGTDEGKLDNEQPLRDLSSAVANDQIPSEELEPVAKDEADEIVNTLVDQLTNTRIAAGKVVEEPAPVTAETETTGGLMSRLAPETSLRPPKSPLAPRTSLRPVARPIETVVEEVKQELPSSISNKVETTGAKTNKDVNVAIFDATSFSGEIPTPKKGDDPIRWIAENTYGLNENDPVFRKAMRSLTKVDPKKTPWCAAFAGHVLKGLGVGLPERAIANPTLAFNYIDLGEDVYNHNPTTGKTYKGSVGDVRPGDIVVFNNGGRQKDGSFKYGKGHISFVVGTEEDGSIIAVGGNQGGGKKVTTTRYTPDIVKKYYKGGFTVRRVNDGTLEDTDPAVIAAITKDISKGGAER